jgi:GNAT superfamily N-acetyltransferase
MNTLAHNAHKTGEYFLRALSKDIFEENGITAFAPNIPDPNLNFAMQTSEVTGDLEATLNTVETFYQQFGLPWSWIISSSMVQDALEDALKMRGYELTTSSPALVRSLEDPLSEDSFKEFDIQEVGEEKLPDWILPLKEAFQATEENALLYQNAHLQALQKKANFHHFVAYADGIPVSAATLSLSPYGARLDDLGTLSGYQRKGFGKALSLYIMKRAKDLGYKWICLESSDDGASLYKKMGFKELYCNRVYEKNRSNQKT